MRACITITRSPLHSKMSGLGSRIRLELARSIRGIQKKAPLTDSVLYTATDRKFEDNFYDFEFAEFNRDNKADLDPLSETRTFFKQENV
jgi:hypothetical protein